jgi:hypothetical protein
VTNLPNGGGANLPDGGSLTDRGIFTLSEFIAEITADNLDPYSMTAAWVNKNIPDNASVWVMPGPMTYPLMFHAPGPVYAWQLPYPPQGQFVGLPDIFFRRKIPPDYMICFGPVYQAILRSFKESKRSDLNYKHIATINCFWKDVNRPELFWRSFTPITVFNRELEAIYVFKHAAGD